MYPTNREAYARLCHLLTLGKRRAAKGECHLTLHDLLDHHAIVDHATLTKETARTQAAAEIVDSVGTRSVMRPTGKTEQNDARS